MHRRSGPGGRQGAAAADSSAADCPRVEAELRCRSLGLHLQPHSEGCHHVGSHQQVRSSLGGSGVPPTQACLTLAVDYTAQLLPDHPVVLVHKVKILFFICHIWRSGCKH